MYKKVKRDEVPKRERKSESRFEFTPEWRRLKADMDQGLGEDDSLMLQFSDKDWERLGLSNERQEGRNTATGAKAVQRFILKYVTANALPYKVRAFHSGSYDYVTVEGPDKKKKR